MRDGPYGFSTLLGRYCGHRRPGTVMSTGRAMWIAFKSDNSVEYTGFQAAFYFFDGKLLNPFIASCSKLLLFEGFSAMLV